MKCKNCGTNVENNANFCTNCGNKISKGFIDIISQYLFCASSKSPIKFSQNFKNINNENAHCKSENVKVNTSNYLWKNIHNVNVVGVLHSYNGVNPQSLIHNLKKNDKVILCWDRDNKYDKKAIEVRTVQNQHIGWLSKDEEEKKPLLNAFKNGNEVVSWVSRIYNLYSSPGNLGIAIGFTIIEEQEIIADDISENIHLDFPDVDEHGKRALTIREADIYGVGRKYNNISAQDVIAKLEIGENVVLKNSKSSYAVKVFSLNLEQIGFLPEWEDTRMPKVKQEVYEKLSDGATVLAKVKKKYKNKNGSIGIVISICRYAVR